MPVGTLLRFAASAAMLVLLLPRIHLESFIPTSHLSTTISYMVAGLLVTFGGFVLSAWRWQRVLTALEAPARLGDLVGHYMAGQFVGNFLPSTIGGDLLRISRATKTTGSSETSFASVVLERLTGWLVLPLLVLAGLIFHPSLLSLGNSSRIALLLSLGTLALLGAVLAMAANERLAGRFAQNDGWTRFIGAVHLGVDRLRRDPRTALGVIGAATAYQLSGVLTVYLATLALDLEVPLSAVLAFAPAVAIAQVLPVSLNGLGVREGAFVLFLGPLGVPTSQAIALGLLLFTMTLVASLLGAPAFAAGGRERVRVA